MKKLMITAAIVCAAIVSQAATANWEFSANKIYSGTGNKTDSYTGTAYLFHGTDQATVFNTLVAGNDITKLGSYLNELTVSAGTISATPYSYGEQKGPAVDWFFVVVDDVNDKAYFSNIKNVASPETDTAKGVLFGSQASTLATPATYSNLAPTGTGFAGQGYWSTVPEPTSGLLLLLGVAGLALRRRRA